MLMSESYLRGHKIELLNNQWVFSDTKEPTDSTYEDRSCGYCNLYQTKEGHDGCLGTLNGIMNACCGHGRSNESYVQFLDGHCVQGKDAGMILDILKKNK